jgi:RND family efflux transporter MFP subunit
MRAAVESATASLREARSALDRQNRMLQQGVGTERERIAAETRVSELEAELSRVQADVAFIGMGSGTAVVLRSPISGTVIGRRANVGMTVQKGSEPVVEVGDPSAIWIVADVFERDLSLVRDAARAHVQLSSVNGMLEGHVASIGTVVATGLRTAPVRIAVEHAPGELRPGMYGRVQIDGVATDLTLPTEAVLIKDGKESFVYVEKDPLTFVRRPVVVAPHAETGRVRIVSGISPGDKVVVRGALLLDGSATSSCNAPSVNRVLRQETSTGPRTHGRSCRLRRQGLSRPSVEAFPDVTNLQVQVIAQLAGLAPEEIERQVTVPLERVLNGTPQMVLMRSESLFGLSLVTLTFDDNADPFRSRAIVNERMQEADLPEGVEVKLAPEATPLGEVYQFHVTSDRHTDEEMRSELEWTISRILRQVPGVADVVTFGGYLREIHVELDPSRLLAHDLTTTDVTNALEQSNRNVGGGFLVHGDQQLTIRGVGYLLNPRDVQAVVLKSEHGTPVTIGDVSRVTLSHMPRLGTVGYNLQNNIAEGFVLMRRGENPSLVLDGCTRRLPS